MRIVLAPMEGLADVHLRRLITAQGGFDWVVSEFVRVVDKLYPARVFERICPELLTNGQTQSGTPVRVQLLGNDQQAMAENAAQAIEMGSHGIDINFGCPSKTVNRRQGGAVLLNDPNSLYEVVAAVRRAVPSEHIVSAKMRLGYQDTSLMLENAAALESAGANEITVHGRTRQQGYKPPVYWDHIHSIVDALSIPVIANGDVVSLAAYNQCIIEAGTVDVMIGRGAVRQPDLARVIRHKIEPGDWSYIESLLLEFWRDISLTLPARDRLGRIKQWLNYLRQRHPEAEALWATIRSAKDPDLIEDMIKSPSEPRAVA